MNTDWFLIPFIINLGFVAYIRNNDKGYIKQILLSTFNYKTSTTLFRENNNNKSKSTYLLYFVFIISSVIFVLQLSQEFFPFIYKQFFWYIPVAIFAFLLIVINLTKLINLILGKLFMKEDLSIEYCHNINVFNKSLGIILFPITVLISFTTISHFFVFVGVILFLMIYLLRIFRLFKINFSKQINILYMFLYLCTLEIIPILYIVKVFVLI